MRGTHRIIGGALLLALAGCGHAPAASSRPIAALEGPSRQIPIEGSPVRGVASAKVTVVMFGDYDDRASIDAYRVVRRVAEAYGDNVRIVYKSAPRADRARGLPAAMFALEARAEGGEAAFWRVHDLLFEQNLHLTDGDFVAVANAAGLRPEPLLAAVARGAHTAAIERDRSQLFDLGIPGPPEIFVNGRAVAARTFEACKAAIDAELARSHSAR